MSKFMERIKSDESWGYPRHLMIITMAIVAASAFISLGGVIGWGSGIISAVIASCAFEDALGKKRQQGREEAKASLMVPLEKEREQLRKKENESRSLITHLQKAEKIKEAKESGDKLAIKSAVLDRASAPERHKREDAIARMTEKGVPLSQINVQRLRNQEERKRLKVNKGLLQNKQER